MIPSKEITVLLADDHSPVRQSLRALLNKDGRIRVIGEARNGREAVEMALRLRPNIVLMDISMPIVNGLEATRRILAGRSPSRIIVLSAHDDKEYKDRAREVGAAGFVTKQMFTETLTWVIHEVAMGRRPGLRARTASPFREKGRPRERLTSRESELLHLVEKGSPKRRIASKLCVSIATVERLLQALMAKLGAPSLADLADHAVPPGSVESSVVLTIT